MEQLDVVILFYKASELSDKVVDIFIGDFARLAEIEIAVSVDKIINIGVILPLKIQRCKYGNRGKHRKTLQLVCLCHIHYTTSVGAEHISDNILKSHCPIM